MKSELKVAGFKLDMRSRRRRRVLVVVVYLVLSAIISAAFLWAPSILENVGLLLILVGLTNQLVFGGLTPRGLVRPFSSAVRPLWFRDDPPPDSVIDRWFWRRSPSRKDLQTDERDDRRRDRALSVSYGVLSFSTYLVWVLFAMVRMGPVFYTKGVPFDFALLVALAVVMLAMTLPQAILLWTEPDMEAEG
jgi:apolipoprotein N-acyltransferase